MRTWHQVANIFAAFLLILGVVLIYTHYTLWGGFVVSTASISILVITLLYFSKYHK